ncbi:MAG: M48 family metallopeptidase [Deltaproteobacteria bacterium]|nr:M48 family metallopeptidase [Deltaproteobacteria bacterium]
MKLYGLLSFSILLFVSTNILAYQRDDEVLLKQQKPHLKWMRPTTIIENLQWDIQLKNAFYDAYLLQFRDKKIGVDVAKDRALIARLNKVFRRLQPNSLMADLPMEVHLVDDPYVNAVCFPGGGIIFFKGIFDRKEGLIDANDEDEIAAVMAHEMSHATLRHGYKQMKNARSAVMVGEIVAAGLGGSMGETWGGLFQLAYYPTLGLYMLQYSRSDEAHADLEGLYTMMKAGFNPEKMVAIWKRAAEKNGKSKHSIFDSHPSNGERVKALTGHLEQIQMHQGGEGK